MNKGCKQYTERLAAVAFGDADADLQQHLEDCVDCSRQLAELKKVVERGSMPSFEPPDDLVNAAKALMPAGRRITRAVLLSSTLSLSGARSSTVQDRFQMVFESDGIQARMMYVQEGRAWQVVGKLSDPAWDVQRAEGNVEALDGGRFEFHAADLTETGLVLLHGDREVHVPSAEEARLGGAE